MKDITPTLRTVGLNDSEIKTYLAALEHGANTVIDISKITRLSRQATYLAIEDLTKRGLMSSVTHGKKKLFNAEHPSKLLAYAKRQATQMQEQIADLERSIPELELQMGGERPVVKVYEGKEGIRAIIEEMKKSGRSKYMEMTDLEAMYKILSIKDLEPLRETLRKLGTGSQGIYSGTPKSSTRPGAERHMVPEAYKGFNAHITIYTDKVIIVTFEGRMMSVIIESKGVAKVLQTMFLLAYETAKKYPSQ